MRDRTKPKRTEKMKLKQTILKCMHEKDALKMLMKLTPGKILPTFVCQAKSHWRTAFGKTFPIQFYQHSATIKFAQYIWEKLSN